MVGERHGVLMTSNSSTTTTTTSNGTSKQQQQHPSSSSSPYDKENSNCYNISSSKNPLGSKTNNENILCENVDPNGSNASIKNKLQQRRSSGRRAVRGGKISQGIRRISPYKSQQNQEQQQKKRNKIAPAINVDNAKAKERRTEIHPVKVQERNNRNNNNIEHINIIDPNACLLSKQKSQQQHQLDQNIYSTASSLTQVAPASPYTRATSLLTKWKSTAIIIAVQIVLMIGAVIYLTPTYIPPSSSTKPFFHTVAEGESFSFEIEVEAWPDPKFQWRLNGVDISGATDKRLRVESANMRHSGTYTCLIENMVGRHIWEEGYVNVISSQHMMNAAFSDDGDSNTENQKEQSSPTNPDDSERVRHARMCLIKRAPGPVKRSAATDGGAAAIAAGQSAGYFDCFENLARMIEMSSKEDPKQKQKQMRALDVLRSLHGSSERRSLLVNVVAALDDLARAKMKGKSQSELEDLSAHVAFEAGLYCASTPRCSGDTSGDSRRRIVSLVVNGIVGLD